MIYLNYLKQDSVSQLNALQLFMKTANVGLDSEVEDGNMDSLMTAMGHIRDVRHQRTNGKHVQTFARGGGFVEKTFRQHRRRHGGRWYGGGDLGEIPKKFSPAFPSWNF